MKRLKIQVFLLIAILSASSIVNSQNNKVKFLLFNPTGNVEYSKDGVNWKKVKRNKFLFEKYYVKTKSNSSCKLINHSRNTSMVLNSSSKIQIISDDIQVITGSISKKQPISNLFGNIERKYNEGLNHTYTAVRRSTNLAEKQEIKLSFAKKITLSKEYPDIVWENIGPEYSYKLIINSHEFIIPPCKDEIIRYKINNVNAGIYNYKILVIKDNKIIYEPNQYQKCTITWLTDDNSIAFIDGLKSIEQLDPENGFLIGNYMEENGFYVGAMYQYEKFLKENPDENEIRPFLIKIYNDLKLKNKKQIEIDRYNNSDL